VVAFASVGGLTSKGCVGDDDHNPDGCARTAKALDGVNSLALSADGRSLYAGAPGDNALSRFKRNRATGALRPRGCIADADGNIDHCLGGTNGLGSVTSLAVSADGRSLYDTSYGANAVFRFKRNRTTGALTLKGCIADPAHNTAGCAKTAKGLDAPDSVAVSADGRSVYVAGYADNAIVRFKRNATTGALTPKGCVGDADSNPDGCTKTTLALNGPQDVTVSPEGKSVYVAGYVDGAIVRFNRSRTTGALTPKGCIADPTYNPDACPKTAPGLSEPWAVAVSPDRKSVYLSDDGDSAIVRFNRSRTTGALTPKGCIADPANNTAGCTKTAKGLDGGTGVAVSPDRKSVYAIGSSDNAIVHFKRNATTGALTPKRCIGDVDSNPDGCPKTAPGLKDAQDVAVSEEGKSVYVAGAGDNAVVRFRRQR
jgi:DNA-binding beta-propeller fold protein YncE